MPAKGKRQAAGPTYMSARQSFHYKLVLNQWLISRFGINPLEQHLDQGKEVRPIHQLAKSLQSASSGLDANRHHHYLNALLGQWQPTWKVTEEALKQYDANIVAHTDAINLQRNEPIEWKYFQWLSLLFIEIYLDKYFSDRSTLLKQLNEYIDQFNAHHLAQNRETGIDYFQKDELNKLCLQNATGSGKTLLMHINVHQFRHYAKLNGKSEDYDRIILISPNERLTEQHGLELTQSNLECEALKQGDDLVSAGRRPLEKVSLTEITKLGDKQGEKTMAVDSFGDANLLLVDEGHRGLGASKSETGWLRSREKLAGRGFTFEYSATFKEAVVATNDKVVEAAYAKTIVFDYAYRYFYEDGYGKDYRIFNLPEKLDDHKRNYLTAALAAFYQQCRYFKDRKNQLHPYNLSSPLWVFVGASVVKDDGKKESANNYKERASDVAEILEYLAWFFGEKKDAIKALDAVINGNVNDTGLTDSEGRDIFGSSFPYIKGLSLSGEKLYQDICATVFQTNSGGSLTVERITGDSGELLLKVGDNKTPFGLINVGDAKGLADHLEALEIKHIQVEKTEFESPIFAEVTNENSPVNLLIGSRKFIEGWNCWRVSSMGLMNTGKKEGSQIIQLFGRGVRLKGKDMSLMRTSRYAPATAEKNVYLLETLNVFGIGAEFMAQFRAFLENEGLPGNENPFIETVKLNVTEDVGKRLKILRPKVRKDTNEQYSFHKDGPLILFGGKDDDLGLTPDIVKQGRKIILDRYPKMETLIADGVRANQKLAETAPPPSVTFTTDRIAFLNFDKLYLDLARYVQSRGYANLLLNRERFVPLLKSNDWYEILVPTKLWSYSMANVKNWQEFALSLLCTLCDKVYNHHRRAYLEPRLELVTLDKSNDNLPDVDVYQLITDASESALIDDIKALKQAFDIDGKEQFDTGRETVVGIKLGAHLYNPLLSAKSSLITIQPVGLNESEFQFVNDLRTWLIENEKELEQSKEEFYLLRNLVKKGVGFFEAGGFYPDFILWRVTKDSQHIVFVDPHGLLHTGEGDEKIEFHHRIKDVQSRLKDEVKLDSVIISPSKTPKTKICSDWKLSPAELQKRNILFMSDKDEYIEQLITIVRNDKV